MNWLTIDGSFGEGGGQLSRSAMALSAITGQPLHLKNIRARRRKPGLMAQHLTALTAVATVSAGVLEGAALGATEIRFQPGRISGGEYHFEVGTAGSASLVLQALLPVALLADGAVRITINGGTDVRMAPPVDYLRLVYLPWLARMGITASIESVRHGYYPKGNGMIGLAVAPRKQLIPLLAEHPGKLRIIRGIAHASHLPLHIPERMALAARAHLVDLGQVHIETKVLSDDETSGTGGAMVLVAETEHSLLGAAAVAERGVPAERLGHDAGQFLRTELEAGAAVDVHAADQLLIYTALARSTSRFTVRAVSQHAQTVMWLIEQFLPVRFKVEPVREISRIEVTQV